MTIRLRFSGIDEETEEKDFETIDAAIKYAKHWFLSGYDNETINDEARASAREYAARLERDLRAGETFHCGMFHERIEFLAQ